MDNPGYQQEAVTAPVDESDFPTKFFQTVLRQHSDAASTALHLLIDQWAEDGLEERRWKYFNSLLSTPNVNINARNRDGITLLESTVNKHLFKLARKLLDIGAVVPNQRVRQVMQV
jgi:ankyrin repeat protein